MNIEIENHSWQYLPKVVYQLHLNHGLGIDSSIGQNRNLLIMLLLPIWIESIVYTVLNQHLPFQKIKNKRDDNNLAKRLIKNVVRDLEKASWGDYNRLAESILGKKLDKFVHNDTWIAVQLLYDFRNRVAHGKPINGRISTGSIELDGIHGKMMEYLIGKKVIKKKAIHIYSEPTVAHFIKITEEFTTVLMNELKDDEGVYLADNYSSILEDARTGGGF